MKHENQEEKKDDVVLLGIKEIGKRIKKSFLELIALKTRYGFPLKKTEGLPSINLRELEEWVKEWGNGLPFEKITDNILSARKTRLDLLAMPTVPLNSIDEIVEFTGCLQHEVINWHKLGSNCPIRKDEKSKVYSVDGKELRLWMNDMGIRAEYRENHGLDVF